MSDIGAQFLGSSTQIGSLARRCFKSCGYRTDLIREDSDLVTGRDRLVGFAHRPFDTRSACIAILHSDATPESDVTSCREIGAALFCTANDTVWNVWAQTVNAKPRHLCTLRPSEVENYFRARKADFEPGTIFRAKTWQRTGVGRQLDFVDAGLLPMIEREAGARLLDLFERMVAVTMNSLGWDEVPNDNDEAHWLTQANFWLLAAKLFHDKRVERFINLNLQDVPTVFGRVATHYNRKNPTSPQMKGRLRALQQAARIASEGPSFQSSSAETLGALYEEGLISPTTRKLLGTHRTPTYLVDYMLAKLSGFIEHIGYQNLHVFEPACGHAPFLSGALRLMSDMLPPAIADDQRRRHDFLRSRLRGCDHDPFALEIARLSLTLADIPNDNGWVLEHMDIFAGGSLAKETAAATVVLANPPFEKEQAATFLRRTVAALQPGTVFGFVLPINELTGVASADTRRQLLAECEIKEISVFPDRMFKFASVETGIVLGRKHEARSAVLSKNIEFRRVRESKIRDFRERYESSWSDTVDAAWLATANSGRLVLPELPKVWDACRHLPRFDQFAKIGQGLTHRAKSDPVFPKGTITESREKLSGLVEGFASIDDSPDTHLTPTRWWLNLDKRTIRRSLAGTEIGTPQIVLNYAPVDRDAWRLKAFIDEAGRAATSDFLLVRSVTLPREVLWAICNSPVSNFHALSFGTKRHTTVGVMRSLRVPDFAARDLLPLVKAVRSYLVAAVEFTTKNTSKIGPKTRVKGTAKPSALGQLHLVIGDTANDHELQSAREVLRALHWRVDAEVLRLYALPPELERALLDSFDGVHRVGVPFEQTRYIPRNFREVLTLDEFLLITDEWDATDTRRCELIEKRIKAGRRTPAEEKEFRSLQRLLTLHRRYHHPQPMIDEDKLRRLLAEDKRQA